MGKRGLTPKQEAFCLKYAECGNASEAYRHAYPKAQKWSNGSVRKAAFMMLENTNISPRIKQLQETNAACSELKRDDVLAFLKKVIEGEEIDDYTETFVRGGKKSVKTRRVSKSWAVDRLCKMLGLDSPEKHEVTGTGPFVIRVVDPGEESHGD